MLARHHAARHTFAGCSKLVELSSEMRQHSGASVSELKRKYNHLVPSNERVLGLAESDDTTGLSEVSTGTEPKSTTAVNTVGWKPSDKKRSRQVTESQPN